jgi:hypothetical protein
VATVSAPRDLLAGWRAWRARGDGAQAAGKEAPEPADATEALAARLLRLAIAGAEALAEPDPALDEERAVMAAHYAAEPSDRPYAPGDPDRLRDGLLAGARGWVLSGGGGMRAAGAPDLASGRTEFRGYRPARRLIPPSERVEGGTGPAAADTEGEFRRE